MRKLSTWNILRKLLGIGMKFRAWFLLALCLSLVYAMVSTYRPYLTMKIIDEDILGTRNEALMFQHIYWLAALVLLESFLNFLLVFLSNFISQNVIRDLRRRLFEKLIYYKVSFFDKTPLGQLVTRAVGDVDTISVVYTDGFLMVFGDVLKIAFVLYMMFQTNVNLSYISLLILPLMVIFTRFFQKKLKKAFTQERNLTSIQNTFVQERLAGMSLIQVFHREKQEYEKFENINTNLKTALLKTVFIFSLFLPVVELVASVFIGLILFYGGYITISAGVVIAFMQYINMLIRPLRQIADRFNNIQRGIVGAERVLGVMNEDQALANDGTLSAENIEGNIRFEDVHFSYDDKQKVLKSISFDIKKGETVAFVGATGAGKSTIISLIPRLYDLDAGKILLDDVALPNYELQTLRTKIGVVLQDVFLFHGTILENITFGNENITKQEVERAAKEIGVHDFITQLPDGYQFIVSERGNSMSLGQRQLLSFLRAYLSNPRILILDEATSSIDIESEKIIQKATERITKNRTSLIIAHRLSTIVNADKIIVMDNGQIVEQGTHEALLANAAYYAKLYQAQLYSTDEQEADHSQKKYKNEQTP